MSPPLLSRSRNRSRSLLTLASATLALLALAALTPASASPQSALGARPTSAPATATIVPLSENWRMDGDVPVHALLISLQGLANRDAARLYLEYPKNWQWEIVHPLEGFLEKRHHVKFDRLGLNDADAAPTGKVAGGSKRSGPGDTTHTGKDVMTNKQSSARGERFNFIIAPGATKSKTRDARDPKIAETKRTLQEHGANSSAAVQLDNLVMNLRVPGNSNFKPGIKLKLSIPANQEEGSLDKRSGDYLLTSVRHIMYRDDKDFKYECVIECKSDSHSKSSPSGTGGVS